MAEKQTTSDSKKSSLLSTLISAKNFQIFKKKTCSKPVHKKTSVEDLAEEGYSIGRVLGEGSYCKVKAAMFKGRERAVKIIDRDQLSTNFESKFLPRELDILTKVRHPNIVHVYKIYKYPRRIYIFMELMRKGDLLHYIMEHGRLSEFEAHKYFKQMVNAILYLHNLNIAHRDLKCENIMIDDNDKVKIIDFGFCRSTVSKLGHRSLSNTFCGSTAYAAPEVLQCIPYNPMMSDVWSLGCILYIMMTGTMPFDSSNVRKLITCQKNKDVTYPSSVTVAEPVKSLISRMLEPDVTKRANMYQVSQCLWLKYRKDYRRRSSADEDDLSDIESLNNLSTDTQEDIVCTYGRLHSSGKCNCRNSSDDSD